MKTRVQCYAGYRGEEEPRSFDLGDRRLEIVDIIDRWLAPDHRYFKVKVKSGDVCMLRYDNAVDEWEITFVNQRRGA